MKMVVNKHQFPKGTKLKGTKEYEFEYGRIPHIVVSKYEISCGSFMVEECQCPSYGETLVDANGVNHCVFFPRGTYFKRKNVWEKEE